MKKILSIIFCTMMMVVCSSSVQAQTEQSKKQRINREELKYYKEYSKFLTQKQIDRAYELERQVMRRLAKHHRQGAGGMKHRTHQGRR